MTRFYRFLPFLIAVFAFNSWASLVITEIHYNPLKDEVSDVSVDGEMFEFIEIKNIGSEDMDVSGYSFTNGITYTFPAGTVIKSGEFLVLASDKTWFESRYGFEPDGQYTGNLKNSGEKVELCDASGDLMDEIDYKDSSPWPIEADGVGKSLVPVKTDRSGDPDLATTWRASTNLNGSPGEDDPQASGPVVLVNEIMAKTDMETSDYIELYNPGSEQIDIGGWYLTDDSDEPKKFKIPENTVISANSFLLFTSADFDADDNPDGFGLNAHGEEVFVFAADQSGKLTGYSHGFKFGESENNVSFGRFVNSVGETHFVAQMNPTPNEKNSKPLVGDVVITEIMYNGTDGVEYIELKNRSNKTVLLYDSENSSDSWKIGGTGFNFPPLSSIAPNEIVLVIDDTISVDEFRSRFEISDDIQIFTYTGNLQGDGESVRIEKVKPSYTDDDSLIIPYFTVDWVVYGTANTWPEEADGGGKSLHRKSLNEYGNDPQNWKAASPSPGLHTTSVIPFKRHNNNRISRNVKIEKSDNTYSIKLNLGKTEKVTVDLFDCSGKLYAKLIDKQFGSGTHTHKFSANNFNVNKLLLLRVNISGKTLFTEKIMIKKL